MSNQKNISKNNKKDEDSKNTVKKTVMIIILIIIIILSLITSCSCTSNFFGRIGSIFRNDGNVDVDDKTNQRVKVKNQDLKFDKTELEISLGDTHSKLSFSYENISPKEFSCVTSNADVATCYVSEGNYVVINPKKAGIVTVTLSTDTNGKTYQATAEVTIVDDIKRQIKLSSKSGTINLAYGKTKSIAYSLIGLDGNVTVTSSNEGVATAKADNGVLKITAKKKGKAAITLSLTYDGKEYTVVYNINVINNKNTNVGKPGSSKPSNTGVDANNGVGGEDPGNEDNPTNPSIPDTPDEPVVKLDNEARLNKLTITSGLFPIAIDFDKDTYSYMVAVKSWKRNIKVEAEALSNKASVVSYSLNGVIYTGDALKEKLPLIDGNNTLVVTVKAEDGTTKAYTVIINKPKSNNSKLKELSVMYPDGISIEDFNKNKLQYNLEVGSDVKKIGLKAISRSSKASVVYTFNGNRVYDISNLNLNSGINTLKIGITSEDKKSYTEYVVIINRKQTEGEASSESKLLNLIDDAGKLLNKFDPHTYVYDIGVGNEVENLGFTATLPNENATLSYRVNGGEAISAPVNSSTARIEALLNEGHNTVEVTITAEDGVTKSTYKINVFREESGPVNKLHYIEIVSGHGVLTPAFDVNTLDYTINVGFDTDSIGFKLSTDNNTNIMCKFNGQVWDIRNIDNLPLNVGKNLLEITVDGKTYKITINRDSDKSHDTSLEYLNVDGKNVLDTGLKANVGDAEKAVVAVKPKHNGASVTYYYEGREYKDTDELEVALKNGINTVTVKVTAEDGVSSSSYDVEIIRESTEAPSSDSSLKEFSINGKDVRAIDELKLSSNENITSIDVVPNHDKASIKEISYIDKDGNKQIASSIDELKTKLNEILTPGSEVQVTVTVGAEDGTTTDHIIVVKKDNEVTEDAILTSLTVAEDYTTIEKIDDDSYIVNVRSDGNSVTLKPTTNGKKIEYAYLIDGTLSDFTEVTDGTIGLSGLTDVDKSVIIRVTGENGNSKDYDVTIHKIKYTIEVDPSTQTCVIGKECKLYYVVKEGNTVADALVNVNLIPDGYATFVNETLEDGTRQVTITPVKDKIEDGKEISVALNAEGYSEKTTATVKFVADEYTIWADKGKYDLPNVGDNNSRSIIIRSEPDLLVGEELDVVQDGKTITICVKNDNKCMTISASDKVNINYNELSNPQASGGLPITVTALDGASGSTYITVSGNAYGKLIDGPAIEVDIKAGYLLTLNSGKGIYDESTTDYEIMMMEGKTVLLSDYPTPYMPDSEDECTYYKFSKYVSDNAAFTVKDEITYEDLRNLGSNLTLVAEYDTSKKEVLERKQKTVLISNIPLFYNADSVKNYGTENAKMIYPGSNGKYTMMVNNKGTSDMVITGIILEERNICVDGGCLNMGYIIRDEAGSYYVGSGDTSDGATKKYEILNKNFKSDSIGEKDYFHYYANDVDLSDKGIEELIIPSGETREITIHWEWVEENDILDTKISNKAASLDEDLMYQLQVALKYDTIVDKCSESTESKE